MSRSNPTSEPQFTREQLIEVAVPNQKDTTVVFDKLLESANSITSTRSSGNSGFNVRPGTAKP
jgi:hypothetical protein